MRPGGWGVPEDYKKDRDTQKWVGDMVQAIRTLDPTRLVEDNSPCNYDHVVNTDLNSWHFYIDDHEQARRHIENVVAETKPGSRFNYCPGLSQSSLPLINSEYGAVSAGGGDRDISWGLRDLTTQLRRHRKIQGYIYTELSDIEWEHNGLVNYDRTPKVFGYDTWVPDMRPNELLGADFIGYDAPPAIVGKPGRDHHGPDLRQPLFGPPRDRPSCDGGPAATIPCGDIRMVSELKTIPITWKPYDVVELEPLKVTLPDYPLVGALILTLRDQDDKRIAANFVNLVVRPDDPLPRIRRRGPNEVLVRFAPGDFAHQHWSEPAKAPPGKVYGYGKGYFEYRLRASRLGREGPSGVVLFSVPSGLEGQTRAGRLARASQPAGLSSDGRDPPLALDTDPVGQRSPGRSDRAARRCGRRPRGALPPGSASSTAATASWPMGWSR